MNSRRCMVTPKLRRLHSIGSNEGLIGAENRPRDCSMQCWRMSRSGSKTEVAALRRDVCFAPVSGHRQAVSACPKSAKKRKSTALFDHFVGARQQLRWNFEAERIGRLEIDHQLEFRRLQYR